MNLSMIFFVFALITGAFSQRETYNVTTFKDMILEFKKVKTEMQRNLNYLTEKVKDLENGISEMRKYSRKRLSMSSKSGMADFRKVAFFANSVTVGHNLKIHQPLTFGNVITNVGNSYHKETGMFVCTVPGYYAFSANVLVDAGNTIRTTIVKNGSVMQQIYSGDPAKNSNGGATIVLHVKPGDLVWVRLETTDGPHAIDWESNFTGFLLYKD